MLKSLLKHPNGSLSVHIVACSSSIGLAVSCRQIQQACFEYPSAIPETSVYCRGGFWSLVMSVERWRSVFKKNPCWPKARSVHTSICILAGRLREFSYVRRMLAERITKKNLAGRRAAACTLESVYLQAAFKSLVMSGEQWRSVFKKSLAGRRPAVCTLAFVYLQAAFKTLLMSGERWRSVFNKTALLAEGQQHAH